MNMLRMLSAGFVVAAAAVVLLPIALLGVWLQKMDAAVAAMAARELQPGMAARELQPGDLVSFRHSAFRKMFDGRIFACSTNGLLWWVDYNWPDGRCGTTLCHPHELRLDNRQGPAARIG